MNAELKAKWVEALRSGKYQQGRAVLRNAEDQMCCLGVLLDVDAPDGWSSCVTNIPGEIAHRLHERGSYSGDFLHVDYRKSIGLTAEMEDGETIAHRLAAMNDEGQSFAQIADFIEQNIPADAS